MHSFNKLGKVKDKKPLASCSPPLPMSTAIVIVSTGYTKQKATALNCCVVRPLHHKQGRIPKSSITYLADDRTNKA